MFLCTTPFEVAISKALTAPAKVTFASSALLAATATSNFFIAVFKADLIILFLKVLVSATLILF
ncbi:hypothetical protein D3C73_1631270 [compost metagenome]